MTQPDPAQQPATTEPAGGTQPGQDPGKQDQPFKTFATQEEYEAAFGPTRTEGRKSLAKSLGFDTLEAFQEKWSGLTKLEQEAMTEKQRIEAERDRYKTESQTRFDQVKQVNMGLALDELVKEANIKPERKEAFLALRKAADGEVDPQTGEVNKELVKHSILTAAQSYPEFVAPPATVGTLTGTPATVAGAKVTTEEQTQKNIKEGDLLGAIGSQLGKLWSPNS